MILHADATCSIMSCPRPDSCNSQSFGSRDGKDLTVSLLGHHHLHELLVVDLTISIDICLTDHLVNLLICQLLAQVGHDVTQLSSRDKPVAIAVKDLEGFNELLLRVCVLHLTCHERQELREVNGSVTISVDLVDHILELSLGRVLTKGTHDCAQLLGGDGAIAILVEEGEGLLELSNLLFSQLVSHAQRECAEKPR